MKMGKQYFSFILILTILFSACQNKEKSGNIELNFTHKINNKDISYNKLIYTNAAGNLYQINEIKYFISSVYFIKDNNQYVKVTDNSGIHYTDLNYSNTLKWNIPNIEEGNYTGIYFVYGLNENDNTSNRFVNPPESNFFWPEILGGGYHYMQINGKFQDNSNGIKNMNFHTGIGRIYANADSTAYAYIHNYFTVSLPVEFTVTKNKTTTLSLCMNVENWFQNPYIYDHNFYGSSIMQNQRAQEIIRENGKKDVFSIQSSN